MQERQSNQTESQEELLRAYSNYPSIVRDFSVRAETKGSFIKIDALSKRLKVVLAPESIFEVEAVRTYSYQVIDVTEGGPE